MGFARARMRKFVGRILSLLIMWGPLGFLLAWGGAYVADCLIVLSAPGKNLAVPIETEQGVVTLTAETYAIDPVEGVIKGFGVRAVDGSGRELARAASVYVHSPGYFQLTESRVRIDARGVFAIVERMEDGSIPITKYFKPQKPEERPIPVWAHLKESEIKFIDRMGGKPFSQRIRVDDVNFESAGNRFTARGKLSNASHGGSLTFASRSPEPSVFALDVNANQLELAPIVHHLQGLPVSETWGEGRKLTADSLVATGPIRLEFGANGVFRMNSQARLATSGLVGAFWHKPMSGSFEGTITENHASGELSGSDGATSGTFQGAIGWNGKAYAIGKLSAKAPSLTSISPAYRKNVASNIGASVLAFDGDVSWSDGAAFQLQGAANAARVTIGGESVLRPIARLNLGATKLTAKLNSGTWEGNPLTAAISVGLDGKNLQGFARATGVDLERSSRRFTDKRIVGEADVDAIFEGTSAAPTVTVRAKGRGGLDPFDSGKTQFAGFDLEGRLAGERFVVNRLSLLTASGIASATGWIETTSRKLNLDLRTTGVEVGDWFNDVKGLATAKVALRGTLSKPTATGRVELFGGEYQGNAAPILVGDLRATNETLTVSNLSAIRGASRLNGELALNFRTRVIGGRLQGVGLQLSDFLTNGAVGTVNVRDAQLAGTLENPTFEAEIDGERWVVENVRIQRVQAEVSLAGTKLAFQNVQAEAAEGSLVGTAEYDLKSNNGFFDAKATDLPLDRFVPLLPGDTLVAGQIGGIARGQIRDGRLASIESEGFLRDLKLNPTLIGNGYFRLSSDGDVWTGSASVGQLERYIQIPNFTYNAEAQQAAATLEANDMPIRDLYFAGRNMFARESEPTKPGAIVVPDSVLDALDRLQGSLDVGVTLSGDPQDPTLDITAIALRNLDYSGDEIGDISLSGQRSSGGAWMIRSAKWTGGPANIAVSGSLEERGEMSLDGEISNLDPQRLAILDERFAKISGSATASFTAKGQTRSPVIVASMDAGLFEDALDPKKTAMSVSLGPVTIQDGGIELIGNFNYEGISGEIDGAIPFKYPFEIAKSAPMSVNFELGKRPIEQLAGLLPGVDLKKSSGTVEANLVLSGTAESLDLTGVAKADLPLLAFKGASATFSNVAIVGDFRDERVNLTIDAKAGNAGSIDFDGQWNLPPIDELNADSALDGQVRGRMKLSNVVVDERFGQGGELKLSVNGSVAVSGRARSPLIATSFPVVINGLNAQMPSEFPAQAPGPEPKISPRFNVPFAIGRRTNPARVRASTANFDLFGSGSLTGSLDAPNLISALTVRQGAIRLPNARIALEEGGSVRFAFTGGAIAQNATRLDVDLDGRTSLSYVRVGGIVQRYDVGLTIRGNILDPDSQVILAQSDPPDLSQAEILGLLGQSQIFETLGQEFLGDRNQSAIGSALASAALPVFFDPITRELAEGLGLEYLNFEYTAFEGASVSLAKSMGKGLIFQGRRQLGETIDGLTLFDYRVTWRPRTRDKTLRNLIFSAGADQDRPWKIAIEWGVRF